MKNNQTGRVVAWLHLCDREEEVDFNIREIWKSVELRPTGDTDYHSKSVPLLAEDARTLLVTPAGKISSVLYEKLGVTSTTVLTGFPKGPYYDPIDTSAIYAFLDRSLQNQENMEKPVPKESDNIIRNNILTLGDQIVESVLQEIKTDPDTLYKIRPRDFERLVAEILRDMGYDVHLTPESRDGGRDILAYITLPPNLRFLTIVECKRFQKNEKIGPDIVKQLLFTLMHQDCANKAMLVTTAHFTSGARTLEEQHKWLLNLRDHESLKEWLNQYGNWDTTSQGGIWIPTPKQGSNLAFPI